MNNRPIVKTSGEFKDTVIGMVKAMPLDDFLLIPQSYIDKYIDAWAEIDPETGYSHAQEEYKRYFQFIMTVPREMHILDMDLYYFRIARKIVDNILVSMLETSYYKTIFGHSDVEYEDFKLLKELIDETADRIEETPDNRRAYKNVKELREEFEKYYQDITEQYSEG